MKILQQYLSTFDPMDCIQYATQMFHLFWIQFKALDSIIGLQKCVSVPNRPINIQSCFVRSRMHRDIFFQIPFASCYAKPTTPTCPCEINFLHIPVLQITFHAT